MRAFNGVDNFQELVDRMFALKDTCLHPKTGKPYIVSASGGRDNSVQGLQVLLAPFQI